MHLIRQAVHEAAIAWPQSAGQGLFLSFHDPLKNGDVPPRGETGQLAI